MPNPNNTFVTIDPKKIEEQMRATSIYKEFLIEKMEEHKTKLVKVTRKKYPEDPQNPTSRQIRHLKLYANDGSKRILEEVALPFIAEDSGENSWTTIINPYTQAVNVEWHASKKESKIAPDSILHEVYKTQKAFQLHDEIYLSGTILKDYELQNKKTDLLSRGLIALLGTETTTLKQTMTQQTKTLGVMKRNVYSKLSQQPEVIMQESLDKGVVSRIIDADWMKDNQYMKNAGPDIIDFFEANPSLTLKEKFKLANAILKAMMILHFHGYQHTDIKLDNICITRNASNEFVATLIDCGPSGGTPWYFAPEFFPPNVYPGVGEITKMDPNQILLLIKSNYSSFMSYKSDIFSLGLVLQQVLGNAAVSYKNNIISKMLSINASDRIDLLLEPTLYGLRRSLAIPEGISTAETISAQTYATEYARNLSIPVTDILRISAANQSNERTLYTKDNQTIKVQRSANDPGNHGYTFRHGEAHVDIPEPVMNAPVITVQTPAVPISVQTLGIPAANKKRKLLTDFFSVSHKENTINHATSHEANTSMEISL